MSDLVRFGISLDDNLLKRFDDHIKQKDYTSRSKAIVDLIQEDLVKQDWISGKEVVGTINLVFDHHKRELSSKLTEVQHNYHSSIISSQHIHLNHADCLEIIVVKGPPKKIKELTNLLKATKGVQTCTLSIATTFKSR